MPEPPTAAALLRSAGLLPDGPLPWGRRIPASGPGVFVVELPAPVPAAPLELSRIGRWIERVPTLRLDGERPTGRALATRLAAFWLPSQPVVFVAGTTASIGARAASVGATELGDRRPAPSGQWLHTLRDIGTARLWWAATDAPEEYEDALLAAFAAGVPDAEAAALPDRSVVLPWANLRTTTGEAKATGITGGLLPDDRPRAVPVQRVVELPAAEADGARDEAKRPRRPAPGRGMGRVAAAAGYAAQGSPRKAAEPVYLSPDGKVRLEAELKDLREVKRPDVISRIASAREMGDLKENAEYHAAREEQSFLEGRIKSLENQLRAAVIVEPEVRGAVVSVGSRVRVEVEGDERTLTVVGGPEADAAMGRISNVSPVGQALLGRRVGDAVTVRTPGGEIRYVVLAIE